ncbi:MAG TPA: hypothetical protein VMB46_02415 [Methanomassiliicoccales archaeon]|nr:hypothetical protein [Methanomassiliicoccales archaeon]
MQDKILSLEEALLRGNAGMPISRKDRAILSLFFIGAVMWLMAEVPYYNLIQISSYNEYAFAVTLARLVAYLLLMVGGLFFLRQLHFRSKTQERLVWYTMIAGTLVTAILGSIYAALFYYTLVADADVQVPEWIGRLSTASPTGFPIYLIGAAAGVFVWYRGGLGLRRQ